MRLQKYLSLCGIASRRKGEEFIASGRVQVNGSMVIKMGMDMDPAKDIVCFDGKPVNFEKKKQYILFYKPKGIVTTMRDPQGRKTVASFFEDIPERIYPVGRLDYDTEGLLLLTNDGDLTYRLTHPSHEVDKTYYAEISGLPQKEKLSKLRTGILLDGKMTLPAKIKLLSGKKDISRISITIREGRKRQIRRMFESIGHTVLYLRRESIGNITLGNLKPGQWRRLTHSEVKYLYSL